MRANDARLIDHRRERLTIGFLFIKVELDAHARKRIARPETLIEHRLNVFLNVLADFLRHLDLRQRLHAHILLTEHIGILFVVENIALLVDNRHVVRLQPLNAVADEIDDALDLLLLEPNIMIQHEHYRRRRRLLVLLIKTVLGQDDVHPRLLDRLNLFDRPRQLTLKRLQVIDLVLKLRHAQLAVVEYLKALRAARQAVDRQRESGIVHVAGQNENIRARFRLLDRVLRAGLLERVDNIAGVFRLQIGVQRNHLGLAAVPKADTEEQD